MKRTIEKFWQKPEKEKTVENNVSPENLSPVDKAMSNLIKMKEATKLLRASAPTVRKYARMGHYREYHFGEKLVFYNKRNIYLRIKE
jgi:hypothetical protein